MLYVELWSDIISKPDAKLRTYYCFKKTYSIENYLLCSKQTKRSILARFRLSSHRLEIELGRHSKPKTIKEDRKCKDCVLNLVGDEFHAIMTCPKYHAERSVVFSALMSYSNFSSLTPLEQFTYIMSYNNGDSEILKTVFPLIDIIMS